MSDRALSVSRLRAGYKKLEVVRELSFAVDRGEIVALLGPNGAGKSTTLLTVAGVLPPLSGEVEVLGVAMKRPTAYRLARAGLALLPDDRGLFSQLSVSDNLRLANMGRVRQSDPVVSLFERLPSLWRRKVGLLSGGEQQMVALAGALLRRPKLLLLDEMSLGLAPQIVSSLLATVRQLADRDGMAVLLVEQHVRVALDVCDRALVLRHGELVLEGSAKSVSAKMGALEESYFGVASGP